MCYVNSIKEAQLTNVIVNKIQERYLSETALDQKIDRGAERVLEAPDDLLPTIYLKLDETRDRRDRREP